MQTHLYENYEIHMYIHVCTYEWWYFISWEPSVSIVYEQKSESVKTYLATKYTYKHYDIYVYRCLINCEPCVIKKIIKNNDGNNEMTLLLKKL